MLIRLVHTGQKKIAVIKEIRAMTGLNLRDAKNLADSAPIDLPPIQDESRGLMAARAFREAGATIEATSETTILDKITAASYIQTAAAALGEDNLKESRNCLRAALRLLGGLDDYGLTPESGW